MAAILDGKSTMSKKPIRKSSTSNTKNPSQQQSQSAFSHFRTIGALSQNQVKAAFGTKKSLASVPTTESLSKRKREDTAASARQVPSTKTRVRPKSLDLGNNTTSRGKDNEVGTTTTQKYRDNWKNVNPYLKLRTSTSGLLSGSQKLMKKPKTLSKSSTKSKTEILFNTTNQLTENNSGMQAKKNGLSKFSLPEGAKLQTDHAKINNKEPENPQASKATKDGSHQSICNRPPQRMPALEVKHDDESKDDTTNNLECNLNLQNRNKRRRIGSYLNLQQQLMPTAKNDFGRLQGILSSSSKKPSSKASFSHFSSKSLTYDALVKPLEHNKPARILPPMKSLVLVTKYAATKAISAKITSSIANAEEATKISTQQRSNDNFVRLNLRNSAGSCRGARNKKTKYRKSDQYYQSNKSYSANGGVRRSNKDDEDEEGSQQNSIPNGKEKIFGAEVFRAGVDPLDDYLDGVLNPKTKATKSSSEGTTDAPCCTRHQRPCKLLVVKKASTGNKGRKFYCCSMPRGEQCDHFKWADDTVEAAKRALLKNSSHSGFMARQVAAYSERFQKLTVPELREAAKRRNLDATGKKKQLLFRLSLWVRDELAQVVPKDGDDNPEAGNVDKENNESEKIETFHFSIEEPDVSGFGNYEEATGNYSDCSFSECSSSDEELELFEPQTTSRKGEEGKNKNAKNSAFNHVIDSTDKEILQVKPTTETTNSKASSTPKGIQETLTALFGYEELKHFQEWAIARCLNNEKSLLVAPTGSGKSMCYIIPAALMEGVCIVVSPLISLIQDQLRELPPRVPAATLSGSLTSAAIAAIIDDIVRNRIKVLFVSPERLASASFQRLFRPRWNKDTNAFERPFPNVSLLCVDEAHCLSQWAHNFRPSYLRLRSLMQQIDPKSVLAITATAGRQVVEDICQALGIDKCGPSSSTKHPSGVLTMKTNRDNIDVKSFVVSSQELRLSLLVKVLMPAKSLPVGKSDGDIQSGLMEGCLAKGSVIVYVWRQRDAEVVAESIQASGVTGGVVFYHGGMDSGARSNAYSKFMRGKCRICVATVAFGLGVNKPDIVGVIHMYLPASPEHYLQEIGRAGRDGRKAKAIALIVKDEALVRHSQSHSDLVSRSQIRSTIFAFRDLVKKTVASIDCSRLSDVSAVGVAIPLHDFSMASDCKSETIETFFSLLELRCRGETPSIQVEGRTFDRATVSLKRRKISKLADVEEVAKVIQACSTCVDAPAGEEKTTSEGALKSGDDYDWEQENTRSRQFAAYSFGSYRFSVSQASNMLGPSAQPRHVLAALRRLQSNGELELSFDKTVAGSALRVILNHSGLQMFLSEHPEHNMETLVDSLYEAMNSIATSAANKVLDINMIMHKVAEQVKTSVKHTDDNGCDMDEYSQSTKSESLGLFQELCDTYFVCRDNETLAGSLEENLPNFVKEISEKEILIDSMAVVSDIRQIPQPSGRIFELELGGADCVDYTALIISKFFHGIPTVRVPSVMCRNHRLFGKWQRIKFETLWCVVQKVLSQK